MMLQYTVYSGVLLAWAGCLWMLAENLPRFPGREQGAWKTALVFAAFSAAALYLASALPVRSGYDNDHDFMCLGSRFFNLNLSQLLSFKEISPLFTDAVSDLLTGRSLAGILWKNRLLLPAAAFLLYAGLRRFGLGKPAAGLACVFFGFNFLALLNANSFATTLANVFILFMSLFAAAEVYAAAEVGIKELLWVFSSMLLVLSARYEFLPAVALIFAAVMARAARRGTLKFSAAGLSVSAAALLLLGVCAFYIKSVSPSGQLNGAFEPFHNLAGNLWTRNLGVIAGGHRYAVLLLVCSIAALATAGAVIGRGKLAVKAAFTVLALWAGYFSCIYKPMDLYPLHFMRHQLYFFAPFVFLLALALDAAGDIPLVLNSGKRLKYGLALLAALFYAYLNAKAVLSFNGERRTNDIELEFLMKAQGGWSNDCAVVYPVLDARYNLLEKYFSLRRESGQATGCLLRYVSPAQAVFKEAPADMFKYGPLKAGESSAAWKALTFTHAFYTARPGIENRSPFPLTIGFFTMTGKDDRSLLEYMKASCAFKSGDYRAASEEFEKAVKDTPACAACGYYAGLSRLLAGRSAAGELAALKKLSAGLRPEYYELAVSAAAGDYKGAADAALKLNCVQVEDPFFPLSGLAHNLLRNRKQ